MRGNPVNPLTLAVMASVAATAAVSAGGCAPDKTDAAAAKALPPLSPKPAWLLDGFSNPESACADPDSGLIYVSNVAGNPADKDGKGWISIITADGRMKEARWVGGLHAPKGIRIANGVLWVSDVDALVRIDIAEKKITRIEVPASKFLNDVAIAPDGTVFVSDMATGRIIVVRDGKPSTFFEGDGTEHPNGLLVQGTGDATELVVAAWGKPAEDFSTKVPGRLYRLNLKTRDKTLVTPDPTGNLDGLERHPQGGWLVSDWVAGKVFHISDAGKVSVLLTLGQGTADIGLTGDGKLLIVPLMTRDQVAAWPVPDRKP